MIKEMDVMFEKVFQGIIVTHAIVTPDLGFDPAIERLDDGIIGGCSLARHRAQDIVVFMRFVETSGSENGSLVAV